MRNVPSCAGCAVYGPQIIGRVARRRSGARPRRGSGRRCPRRGRRLGSSTGATPGNRPGEPGARPVLRRSPLCADAIFRHPRQARHGTPRARRPVGQRISALGKSGPGSSAVKRANSVAVATTSGRHGGQCWKSGTGWSARLGRSMYPTVSGSNRRLDGIRERSSVAVVVLPQPKVPFSQTITWSRTVRSALWAGPCLSGG